MSNNSDDVAIDQPSPSNTIATGADSRRLLMWAHMDLTAGTEVSTARRLAAWIALGVTFMIALMLLLGY